MNTTPIDIIAWFAYLLSAVMFVMGLHYMNSPKTARKGNFISAAGMVVAVVMAFVKLFITGFENAIAILLLIAGGIFAILQGWLYTGLLWAGAFGCLMAALNFRDSKNDGG